MYSGDEDSVSENFPDLLIGCLNWQRTSADLKSDRA